MKGRKTIEMKGNAPKKYQKSRIEIDQN